MRIVTGAAIIALLFVPEGSAQSVADAARAERIRRQDIAGLGPVYTTESIRARYGVPATEGPSADAAVEAQFLDAIQRIVAEMSEPGLSDEDRIRLAGELEEAGVLLAESRIAAGGEAAPGLESPGGSNAAPGPGTGVPQGNAADPVRDWQAALARQQAEVRELEDREVQQSLEVGRLRGLLTAPTGNQRERNRVQASLGRSVTELDAIRVTLLEARAELAAIQAEGPAER